MRVLVTGATGLIGGAVARRLKRGGHEVVGLARSERSAAKLGGEGFTVVHGDLSDGASVADAVHGVDAVVHAASPGDLNTAAYDETAVRAIIGGLRGTSKRFVYTSGCLVYGSTGDTPATEDSPLSAVELVRFREALEREILGAADHGIHPVVIRPGWVYGNRGGTAMMMVGAAEEHGVARYVGDGRNRWTTVHADDLADLYALALERAPAGSVFNGVHGAATPLIEIARAASEGAGAGGRVEAWALEYARSVLWAFADAIACDQVVSGEKAERELGWRPSHRSIVYELRSYRSATD
ncbi:MULTISPECIES: NAD-dependent epimerase/dehydratase family protein [Methylobacterium]|jgi:nucleoside-diphosphate-sugar epimerase|uniref:NAD-dependent epimerase n=2 Tax=Methylobacterium TaxID=407 RepID=A0A2R4WTS8_9HYPH|nr:MULTISPECIES: NAD-dependent epimerase/dehydratase family protein [Methylobacterium]MBZ6414534.1 NAD-dependent epimerase/dehydratase family protein [Methylobacterium sp.]AWB24957.1 NAD-dependent epimerase [Methylobacterium currus]MBK3401078.1 NAD-dependent epimerase/dehydratase family protein [Methylobacterium ajmalii]MBK3411282.1 NAD-dependent epimerase/dehydratase family protein [Methylobacterium ajmalii]MBK3424779.1 NAD-dependent epimerase/dehydratase family protein [Methylobacterium ajma